MDTEKRDEMDPNVAGNPNRPAKPDAPPNVRNLAKTGDYRGLWRALLATLPRCSDGCGRLARFQTTYSRQFSCGKIDHGCEKADGDEWEEVPWKDHVQIARIRPVRRDRASATRKGVQP